MATIIHKIKKGRPYYYAVQCQRVNGKPRIVWQKYLGTVDAIVARAEDATPPRPREVALFEAGGVAGLLRVAQRLGLVDLIDEIVPKRDQGPSVGHYMLLAAINRALAPCSKLAIGDWYEQTVLRRLWGFPASAFSSPRFWDHMDRVSEEAIDAVQQRLLPRLRKEFEIDAQLLLYDTTNFFTFLASSNDRASLPQRGHNKQKRNDLRQVGLALLVDRAFQIPLLHHAYAGQIPDVTLFAQLSRDLIARYRRLGQTFDSATLVFDKGNVSDDGMENLVVEGIHFVAALPASRCPELLAIPWAELEPIEGMPGTRALARPQTLWGVQCQVVVDYTESFFAQQLAGVTQHLVKCQKKLLDLGKALERWQQGKGRGRRPTVARVRRTVRDLVSGQFMSDLIQTHVDEHKGLPRLQFSVDHEALRKLTDERLGKTLLVCDRPAWGPREIIASYRSLSGIEDVFKNMKNIDFLHWQPAYHWTDQKLRVHAFYCVMALLLSTLARRVAAGAGLELTLPALLEQLSAIREVAILYPDDPTGHPKDQIALSRMSPTQRKLAEVLQLAEVLHGG